MRRETPYMFFKKNAGFSYNPKTETPEQGKQRYARALAEAERMASDAGCSFAWTLDDITNREFTDEGNEYPLWACVMRDPEGKVCESLGGCDFGEDRDPWMDSYRRVVEAELAIEHFWR